MAKAAKWGTPSHTIDFLCFPFSDEGSLGATAYGDPPGQSF